MADGTISHAKGEGSIYLNGLWLKSVLFVPNLRCNLRSISKLTRDQNYKVIFTPASCIFQNLTLGKMIGNAEEQEGLFYMKEVFGSSTLIRLPNSLFSSTVSDSSIRLWHN